MSTDARSAREQANLELAERFYKALFGGDWEAVRACISDDFVVVEADGMPYGGTWKGLEGFLDLFGQMSTKYFEGLDIRQKALTATDEYIFTYFVLSGVARPTGRKVEVEILERMDVRDGRIASIRPFYWDTKALAQAFGK